MLSTGVCRKAKRERRFESSKAKPADRLPGQSKSCLGLLRNWPENWLRTLKN